MLLGFLTRISRPLVALSIGLVVFSIGCRRSNEHTSGDAPYLGQEPPGTQAEVFAPGIVSTDSNEVLYGIFDDGSLLFFDRAAADFDDDWIHVPFYRVQKSDGIWTEPEQSPITGRPWFFEYPDAPAGTVIVFPWRKNLDGSGPERDIDIWRVIKGPDDWAAPERLGNPVNTDAFDSWPSLSDNGTLYFFSTREGGYGRLDLYRSVLRDSAYREVENLGDAINTEFAEHDPFIAPDESYLLWCSDKPGGFGENDLYISFRTHDGTWTSPINLGDSINSTGDDTRPSVTTDGAYLFFNSTVHGSRDVFWVSAEVIENLRPR